MTPEKLSLADKFLLLLHVIGGLGFLTILGIVAYLVFIALGWI